MRAMWSSQCTDSGVARRASHSWRWTCAQWVRGRDGPHVPGDRSWLKSWLKYWSILVGFLWFVPVPSGVARGWRQAELEALASRCAVCRIYKKTLLRIFIYPTCSHGSSPPRDATALRIHPSYFARLTYHSTPPAHDAAAAPLAPLAVAPLAPLALPALIPESTPT